MGKCSSPVVIDMTGSPYPVGCSESLLAVIARRAVGGKVAMIERGSRTPMIVSVSSGDPDIVSCDMVDVDDSKKVEN